MAHSGIDYCPEKKYSAAQIKELKAIIMDILRGKGVTTDSDVSLKEGEALPLNKNFFKNGDSGILTCSLYRTVLTEGYDIRQEVIEILRGKGIKAYLAGRASIDIFPVTKGMAVGVAMGEVAKGIGIDPASIAVIGVDDDYFTHGVGRPLLEKVSELNGLALTGRDMEDPADIKGAELPSKAYFVSERGPRICRAVLKACFEDRLSADIISDMDAAPSSGDDDALSADETAKLTEDAKSFPVGAEPAKTTTIERDKLARIILAGELMLVKVLKDPDAYVQGGAAASIGAMFNYNPQKAEELLLKALKIPNLPAQEGAAASVGAMFSHNPQKAEALLAETLKDPSGFIRGSAAAGIVAMFSHNPQKAEELLVEALKDPSEYVRRSAAITIGMIFSHNPQKAEELLVEALRNPDRSIQRGAAAGIGAMFGHNPTKAEELLVEALKNPDEYVREGAAAGIGAMFGHNPTKAQELLTKALEDSSPTIRKGAVAGIGAIFRHNPTKAQELLTKALEDSSPAIRKSAAAGIGAMFGHNPTKAEELLIEALRNPDRSIQRGAAAGIGAMFGHNPTKAEELLGEALKNPDEYVRGGAAASIGAMFNALSKDANALIENARAEHPFLKDLPNAQVLTAMFISDVFGQITPEDIERCNGLRNSINDDVMTGEDKDTYETPLFILLYLSKDLPSLSDKVLSDRRLLLKTLFLIEALFIKDYTSLKDSITAIKIRDKELLDVAIDLLNIFFKNNEFKVSMNKLLENEYVNNSLERRKDTVVFFINVFSGKISEPLTRAILNSFNPTNKKDIDKLFRYISLLSTFPEEYMGEYRPDIKGDKLDLSRERDVLINILNDKLKELLGMNDDEAGVLRNSLDKFQNYWNSNKFFERILIQAAFFTPAGRKALKKFVLGIAGNPDRVAMDSITHYAMMRTSGFNEEFITRWNANKDYYIDKPEAKEFKISFKTQLDQIMDHLGMTEEAMAKLSSSHPDREGLKEAAEALSKIMASLKEDQLPDSRYIYTAVSFIGSKEANGIFAKELITDLRNLMPARIDASDLKDSPRIRITSDPSIFMRAGLEPYPTCQRCSQRTDQNKDGSLINRLINGQFKLAQYLLGNTVIARVHLEVTLDSNNNPILLVEKIYQHLSVPYDNDKFESEIVKYAHEIGVKAIYWSQKPSQIKTTEEVNPNPIAVEEALYRDSLSFRHKSLMTPQAAGETNLTEDVKSFPVGDKAAKAVAIPKMSVDEMKDKIRARFAKDILIPLRNGRYFEELSVLFDRFLDRLALMGDISCMEESLNYFISNCMNMNIPEIRALLLNYLQETEGALIDRAELKEFEDKYHSELWVGSKVKTVFMVLPEDDTIFATITIGGEHRVIQENGSMYCNYIVLCDPKNKKAAVVHTNNEESSVFAEQVIDRVVDELKIQGPDRKDVLVMIARPSGVLMDAVDNIASQDSAKIESLFAAAIKKAGFTLLESDTHAAWYDPEAEKAANFLVDEGVLLAFAGNAADAPAMRRIDLLGRAAATAAGETKPGEDVKSFPVGAGDISPEAEHLAVMLRSISHDAAIFDVRGQLVDIGYAIASIADIALKAELYSVLGEAHDAGEKETLYGLCKRFELIAKEIGDRSKENRLDLGGARQALEECKRIRNEFIFKRNLAVGTLAEKYFDNLIYTLNTMINFASLKLSDNAETITTRNLVTIIDEAMVAERDREIQTDEGPAPRPEIEVDLTFDIPEAATIKINSLYLKAVIFNILKNCVDFADKVDEKKPVEIKVTLVKINGADHVQIQVEDKGPGIRAVDLPEIWKLGGSTQGTGRGLGLALVRLVMEDTPGCSKEVTSKHIDEYPEDHGAIFTLRIPVTTSPAAPAAKPAEAAKSFPAGTKKTQAETEKALEDIFRRHLLNLRIANEQHASDTIFELERDMREWFRRNLGIIIPDLYSLEKFHDRIAGMPAISKNYTPISFEYDKITFFGITIASCHNGGYVVTNTLKNKRQLGEIAQRLIATSMPEKEIQRIVAKRTVALAKKLHSKGIRDVIVSGRSALVTYSLLKSAWRKLYPKEPLRFHTLSAAGNNLLYDKYSGMDTYENFKSVKRVVEKELGITFKELSRRKTAYIEEHKSTGNKISAISTAFATIGFNPSFMVIADSPVSEGNERATLITKYMRELAKAISAAIGENEELSNTPLSESNISRFEIAINPDSRTILNKIFSAIEGTVAQTASSTKATKSLEAAKSFPAGAEKPQAKVAAAPVYDAARALVPTIVDMMMRGAPTYSIEPAISIEDVASTTSNNRTAEQLLGKRGHDIHAKSYLADENSTKAIIGILTKMLPGFCKDIAKDPKTRLVIRLVSKDGKASAKADIIKFLEQELLKITDAATAKSIIEEKIRFVEAQIGDATHLNTVIDLFTDLTMMECDRYGKPGQYEEQIPEELGQKFSNLLELSISNFEDFKGLPVEDMLKKVFGGFALRIKAIDWKSIDQWKKQNDEVLKAL